MENETKTPQSTIPAINTLPPIFSKKQLFFALYPTHTTYGRHRMRRFFTDEFLASIGLTFDQYKWIKVFNFDQCNAIREKLNEICK